MANIGKILRSGALGLGTALIARNPKSLRAFGLGGNELYNELQNDQEEKIALANQQAAQTQPVSPTMKKGGKVKRYEEGGEVEMAKMEKTPFKPTKTKSKTVYAKKGGSVASKRADGIAQRGKTKGRVI